MDVPTYPKPLFITDAAVNIFPTLEDKVDIVQNAWVIPTDEILMIARHTRRLLDGRHPEAAAR
jgi:hypothetical protein